jgi:hypothetical protein
MVFVILVSYLKQHKFNVCEDLIHLQFLKQS